MLVVKFLRGYQSYLPNDIAGFDDKKAELLISKKYAEPLGEMPASEQPLPKGEFKFNKEVPKIGELICAVCGKSYKTKTGLKNHLWKKHGIK